MRTDPKTSFLNDLKKVSGVTVKAKIEQVVLAVIKAPTIRDIPKLRKLKGYRNCYRIKVGDYRIGVIITGDLVTFERCLLRKAFFRFFP